MDQKLFYLAGRIVTFLAVVVAWVLFKSQNMRIASQMLKAMTDLDGMFLTFRTDFYLVFTAAQTNVKITGIDILEVVSPNSIIRFSGFNLLIFLLFSVWFLPNTQQIFSKYKPTTLTYEIQPQNQYKLLQLSWYPSVFWLLILMSMNLCSISAIASISSEFLYFQF